MLVTHIQQVGGAAPVGPAAGGRGGGGAGGALGGIRHEWPERRDGADGGWGHVVGADRVQPAPLGMHPCLRIASHA